MVATFVQLAIIVFWVALIQHLVQLALIQSMKAVEAEVTAYLVKTTGTMICQVKRDAKNAGLHQLHLEDQQHVLALVQIVTSLKV